jgi:RNA polymerase sigma-70 factor (ECF subfamily)
MAPPITPDPAEWDQIQRAAQGEARSLDELFARYRPRLKRMVRLRLDPRAQGRVDPSEILQRAYLETGRRLGDYVREPGVPFFLWLRQLTGRELERAHRQHLGAEAAGGAGEVSLHRGALPGASPAALAAQLLGREADPGADVARARHKVRIQEALNGMDALDREVLTLRHFERLTNAEAALVLGLGEAAACNRYVRALERLRGVLGSAPGALRPWGGTPGADVT